VIPWRAVIAFAKLGNLRTAVLVLLSLMHPARTYCESFANVLSRESFVGTHQALVALRSP
jgi:hypothetical protein